MNIFDVTTGTKKINVQGKIQSKGEVRNVNLKDGGTNQTCEAALSDNTGTIKLVLWGAECSYVKVGDTVNIENGYSSDYKGVTQLAVGKFGKLSVVGSKPLPTANTYVTQADLFSFYARLAALESEVFGKE